ncbi:heme-binding protein [Bradyrhizobium sp. Leo121]|uniref:heme-binding protein n=1 Tax=Bradyrhizobium sp. Leo121 TaxID=1571195 RepID=UPI001FE0F6EC|nr:heme-binding protein [Bradyrhizobium sp. Leo121]
MAQAALADCQKRDYQVAVAVVDRFGVVQVVLRDRCAGPHMPPTLQPRSGRRRPSAAARAIFSLSVSTE